MNSLTAIFLVVDYRKNIMTRKTEFHLVRVQDDLSVVSQWSALKRASTKAGIDFVPMRKVLFTGEDDVAKDVTHGNK